MRSALLAASRVYNGSSIRSKVAAESVSSVIRGIFRRRDSGEMRKYAVSSCMLPGVVKKAFAVERRLRPPLFRRQGGLRDLHSRSPLALLPSCLPAPQRAFFVACPQGESVRACVSVCPREEGGG